MKTKKNFIFLIENGISHGLIFKMTNNQVKVLVEKFKKMKKSESKEQVEKKQKETITIGPQGGKAMVGQTEINLTPAPNKPGYFEISEKELSEDTAMDYATGYNPNEEGGNLGKGNKNPQDYGKDDPNGIIDGMPTEGELREKFESKAQQGLFWARCKKCSSKNCKWCKMAKEFSDSTSKKEYKKLPEKKHPEKTLQYKKTKTNEGIQKFLEKTILKLVEDNIEPKMSKKELLGSIKKKSKKNNSMIIRRPKKVSMFSDEAPTNLPIAKMFSIGKK